MRAKWLISLVSLGKWGPGSKPYVLDTIRDSLLGSCWELYKSPDLFTAWVWNNWETSESPSCNSTENMMEQWLSSTKTVIVERRSLFIFFRQLSPKRRKSWATQVHFLSANSSIPQVTAPDLGRSELGYEEEHHSKSLLLETTSEKLHQKRNEFLPKVYVCLQSSHFLK